MNKLAITDNGVFVTGSKAFLTVDGVHRKVLKMYCTTDGVHRLCFSGMSEVEAMTISYTGNMTDEVVTMSGVQYRLLTLTSSGTLTLSKSVKADVWMCNGGNSGRGGNSGAQGGAGGYVKQISNRTLSLSTSATIGAGASNSYSGGTGGGRTRFGGTSPTAQSSSSIWDGASGGGQTGEYDGGNGAGTSTIPFGESTIFNMHSAGGGGGADMWEDYDGYHLFHGGEGGSNGSDGLQGSTEIVSNIEDAYAYGGPGGSYRGGTGGGADWDGYADDGSKGRFYGAGGGGGGSNGLAGTYGAGGSGYQGVIYIRIPINQ